LVIAIVLSTGCESVDLGATEQATRVVVAKSPSDTPLPVGVDADTGFRMKRYRSPVPDTNPGTEVVDTARAVELHATGEVVFLDVYPPRGLGADPVDGTWLTNEMASGCRKWVADILSRNTSTTSREIWHC